MTKTNIKRLPGITPSLAVCGCAYVATQLAVIAFAAVLVVDAVGPELVTLGGTLLSAASVMVAMVAIIVSGNR